jgi:acyl carrier protein
VSRAEINDAVVTALADAAPHVDVATVAPGDHFQEDLELDSLDFLQLVERLAELTGIEVPERDYGELVSIDATVDYLTRTRRDAETTPPRRP